MCPIFLAGAGRASVAIYSGSGRVWNVICATRNTGRMRFEVLRIRAGEGLHKTCVVILGCIVPLYSVFKDTTIRMLQDNFYSSSFSLQVMTS